MNASLDVTKIKGYVPRDETPDIFLIPVRHACGRVLYADLDGDYPVFYPPSAADHTDRLRKGKKPVLSCPFCAYPLDMDWMRPLYLVSPMRYDLAVRTCGHRVCSNCWGQLQIASNGIPVLDEESGRMESHVLVLCHECKYETIAYVTQRYVGFARERDYLDYGRCVIGLSEALELTEADGIPVRIKSSRSELIASLGF